LDFSTFKNNQFIGIDDLSAYGLKIRTSSSSSKCVTPEPIIIDTNNPVCDPDLKSPFGNAIIIQEKYTKNDGCDGPDDCAAGGSITFTWESKVNLKDMIFLDMDEAVTVSVNTASESNKLLTPPPLRRSGEHVNYAIDENDVLSMEIKFHGSGGIPLINWSRCEPGGNGDPHFQTWAGHKFDYHGQCDLVLITAPYFEGKGLDLHVRTEQRDFFSFINTVAAKIGDEILEIGMNSAFVNGKVYDSLTAGNSSEFAGYSVTYDDAPLPNGRQQKVYMIKIGAIERIQIKVFGHFMALRVLDATHDNFADAVGLTGDYNSGLMLGRDGVTLLNDPNDFGPEWQVNADDPVLFRAVQSPQFPEKCLAAPSIDKVRHLRNGISQEQAEEACAVVGEDIDDCVFDIMATGDLDMVGAHM
jgi:hypothetical protein